MEQTNHYLSDFERFEKDRATPAVQRLRKAAIARFAELGFPGPRDEEWRFTPLAPLVQTAFRRPPDDTPKAVEGFHKLVHAGPGVSLACINANRPFLLNGSRPLPDGVI